MKSIAEYFRDLAADDRYFGAEPPTPDAEMLHRIAEREARRQVEAKVDENGVHLRQTDHRRPLEQVTTASGPAHRIAPATATPPPVAHGVAAYRAPPVPADGSDAVAESVAEKLKRIRAAVARAQTEPQLPSVFAEDEQPEPPVADAVPAAPAPAETPAAAPAEDMQRSGADLLMPEDDATEEAEAADDPVIVTALLAGIADDIAADETDGIGEHDGADDAAGEPAVAATAPDAESADTAGSAETSATADNADAGDTPDSAVAGDTPDSAEVDAMAASLEDDADAMDTGAAATGDAIAEDDDTDIAAFLGDMSQADDETADVVADDLGVLTDSLDTALDDDGHAISAEDAEDAPAAEMAEAMPHPDDASDALAETASDDVADTVAEAEQTADDVADAADDIAEEMSETAETAGDDIAVDVLGAVAGADDAEPPMHDERDASADAMEDETDAILSALADDDEEADASEMADGHPPEHAADDDLTGAAEDAVSALAEGPEEMSDPAQALDDSADDAELADAIAGAADGLSDAGDDPLPDSAEDDGSDDIASFADALSADDGPADVVMVATDHGADEDEVDDAIAALLADGMAEDDASAEAGTEDATIADMSAGESDARTDGTASVAEGTPADNVEDAAAPVPAGAETGADSAEDAAGAASQDDVIAQDDLITGTDAADDDRLPPLPLTAAQRVDEAEGSGPVAEHADQTAPLDRDAIRATLGDTGLTSDDEHDLIEELIAAREETSDAPLETDPPSADAWDDRDDDVPVKPATAGVPFADPEATAASLAASAAEAPRRTTDTPVTRLLAQTDDELRTNENTRRRSAIAHLKAAVAAVRAEGGTGEPKRKADTARTMDKYREDLASAVSETGDTPVRGDSAKSDPPQVDASDAASDEPMPEFTEEVAENPPAKPRRKRWMAPLMLVSEQRVDRKAKAEDADPVRPRRIRSDEVDDPEPMDAPAGTDATITGFAQFVQETGPEGLQELLEASAAFGRVMDGDGANTRPQIMSRVMEHLPDGSFSREEGLRAFGVLLREGRILRVERGRFTIAPTSRFNHAEKRSAAG